MTYLYVNLFYITATQHYTNTIIELFLYFFYCTHTHTHFHCWLPHQNTVTVGGFTALLCSVIHFAKVTKEWGFFAVKWLYVLAAGFSSCVT
jgi:hypothetical protein